LPFGFSLPAFLSSPAHLLSGMPFESMQQIEQREKEYPDHVNQMPVQTGIFKLLKIRAG